MGLVEASGRGFAIAWSVGYCLDGVAWRAWSGAEAHIGAIGAAHLLSLLRYPGL